MGRLQEWITHLEKYGHDVSEEDDLEAIKRMRTKWKLGFVLGDPWEERVVVFDEELLSGINQKTYHRAPGLLSQATGGRRANVSVLMLAFCHGNYDGHRGVSVHWAHTQPQIFTTLLG